MDETIGAILLRTDVATGAFGRSPFLSMRNLEYHASRLCGRAADRKTVDAQRRLTDADRHALSVLAAGADTGVEFHVVADHLHARECIGAIADQCGALDRRADFAVLDQVGFRAGEDEL